jgi:signal transduction histidine kinase
MVEAHGGSIEANSGGAGCGTTFRFTLPVAGAVPGTSTLPAESGPNATVR